MKNGQWEKVKDIFDGALHQKIEDRLKYINEACDQDKELRDDVESLLASFDRAEEFMETPAIEEVAEVIENETKKPGIRRDFGHYEIVRQIGYGGMGEVYLAKDNKLDRQVAIKILNEKFSRHESNLQRFVQEAKAASSLNHPNILVIHEIGESQDTHFIVSEYIEGKTLRTIINSSLMELNEILDISIQIANALSTAHQAHIVHRDIKPENIMIRPDGYVKILDFGLAKLIEQKSFLGMEPETTKQNETAKGIILGTINYMSPEQAKGEKVDEKTDIFSFGEVIYEMFAGKTPFQGDSISETFANLIKVEPQPLSNIKPNIPKELQRIVLKMLRKNKTERYQTMKDLFADLKSLHKRLEFETEFENSKPPQTGKRTYLIDSKVGNSRPNFQNSIAVLPFANMSADAENEYFCDGLAEELLNALSKIENLKVAARTSAFSFKGKNVEVSEIGNKLNVQKIVEGSVRKIGNRVRISVQLINANDGYQLWSERYDLEMKDIFEIQDEITLAVVDALKVNLQSGEKSALLKRYAQSVEAYEYLLKGNYYLEKRNLVNTPEIDVAIEMFKKAIEIDPNYALAHARLGYCYVWKAVYNDAENPKWIELTKKQLEKAESINPELPQIYEARNQIIWSKYGNFDIPSAVREVLRGRQFDSHSGHGEMAIFAFHTGMEDIAVKELKLAVEIDPSSDYLKFATVDGYALLGRHTEAINIGIHYGCDANGFTHALLWQNRVEEAEAALNEALTKAPNNPRRQGEKVLLLAVQEKFEEAEALIPQIYKKITISQAYHHVTYDFACAYALNGKAEESVRWLKETFDNGMPIYPLFERDPHLNRIRNSPEFIEFMQSIKPKWESIKSVFEELL